MGKNAIVLGATGLIGSNIVDLLCKDDFFSSVKVIVRREIEVNHPKLTVDIIDFDNQEAFKEAIKGADIVFCAVGTTRKNVKGDMVAYRKVDYDIPINAAKYSAEWGVKHFAVVSSIGADRTKTNFYLKMKGEMEDRISNLGVPSLHIFRPSLLLGSRVEKRLLEDIGQFFLPYLSFFFPTSMKPIEGKTVAHAMVNAVKNEDEGIFIYEYKEMKA